MPISNQKTRQSYNFKGISLGSSDENIFFTADGVKFEGHGFAAGEKTKRGKENGKRMLQSFFWVTYEMSLYV